MSNFLKPTDPDAFVDFLLPTAEHVERAAEYGLTKPCPVCQTYGGWNLELNAYKLREDVADTRLNRHLYSHFRGSCSHCNGWGFVRDDENCPRHEWIRVENVGKCLNQHECAKCGKNRTVDSSD